MQHDDQPVLVEAYVDGNAVETRKGWEQALDKTWEDIREDSDGLLQAKGLDEQRKKKRR